MKQSIWNELDNKLKLISKENYKKNFKLIMKWFMNFTILIPSKKRLGTNNIKMKPINFKLLSYFKNRKDFEMKQDKCMKSKKDI